MQVHWIGGQRGGCHHSICYEPFSSPALFLYFLYMPIATWNEPFPLVNTGGCLLHTRYYCNEKTVMKSLQCTSEKASVACTLDTYIMLLAYSIKCFLTLSICINAVNMFHIVWRVVHISSVFCVIINKCTHTLYAMINKCWRFKFFRC